MGDSSTSPQKNILWPNSMVTAMIRPIWVAEGGKEESFLDIAPGPRNSFLFLLCCCHRRGFCSLLKGGKKRATFLSENRPKNFSKKKKAVQICKFYPPKIVGFPFQKKGEGAGLGTNHWALRERGKKTASRLMGVAFLGGEREPTHRLKSARKS